MAKDKIKKVKINNVEFSIMRFGYWDGLDIRIQLVKILAPTIGAFVGKGLSELKSGESSEDVKKLSTADLISKLDGDILQKVGKTLSENLASNNVRELYEKLLSVVMYKNAYVNDQLVQLINDDVISYSDVDKLILEVVSHQGFFGSLLKEVQEKMITKA